MKSIRGHLLAWLLPGFVVLWFGAGASIYFWGKQRFEDELNADLGDYLAAIPFGSDADVRGLVTFQDLAKDDFGIYFQFWTEGGIRLLKSENLGQFEMNRPELEQDAIVYQDAVLGNEDSVRMAGVRRTVGSIGGVDIVVAKTREEADESLGKMLIAIVVIGGLTGGAFVFLLGLALRSGLKPLVFVGEQAARIEADSLGARFPREPLPQELSPIVEKLNDLMERLEASFARERRFSSDLAHELRTPVAALRTTAEVALKWPDQASAEDYEDVLNISGELQTTIENMLTLARLEKAADQVEHKTVVVTDSIEDCWQLFAPRASERGITLANRVRAETIWQTDPKLFRVILSNLYSNAVEYAPRDSEVEVYEENSSLVVRNLAPHLVESDLSKLFDRLWRHDQARTDSSHSGLGLSLAKTCAEVLSMELAARLDDGSIEFLLKEIAE